MLSTFNTSSNTAIMTRQAALPHPLPEQADPGDRIPVKPYRISNPSGGELTFSKDIPGQGGASSQPAPIDAMCRMTAPGALARLEARAIDGAAGAAARSGEHCQSVAARYGIISKGGLARLEQLSISGVAEAAVSGGGNCQMVAARYGITSPSGLARLERAAARGVARGRVENGDNCRKVAEDHGIRTSECRALLEQFKIDKLALEQQVMAGKSIVKIAERYGIDILRPELGCFAVVYLDEELQNLHLGVAGLAAYRGGDCRKIAEKYGIVDEKPRQLLEQVSVKYAGARKRLQGVALAAVIEQQGITTAWAIEKLRSIHKSPLGFVYQPNREKRFFQSGAMGRVHDRLNNWIFDCSIHLGRSLLTNDHPAHICCDWIPEQQSTEASGVQQATKVDPGRMGSDAKDLLVAGQAAASDDDGRRVLAAADRQGRDLSGDGITAVGQQAVAGNKSGIVTGEEGDYARHFLRCAGPARDG